MRPLIIGIAWGTGSGKTTLVENLKEQFGSDISVLPHDNYYAAHHDMSLEERQTLNYDHPAAFDTDPAIVGRSIAGVPVRSIDQLDEYLAEHPTSVGVLTVPQTVALTTAQRLIAGGVKGIWNFTNIELGIRDESIVVENVHFADSLLALSYLITPRSGENSED